MGAINERVGDLGEHALIRRISQRMATTDSVVVGIGDDAAVAKLSGDAVMCTDAMVEGVHFRRQWSSPSQIGGKIVARNFADIAAMGATPVGFTLSLTVPADLESDWVKELISGVNAECERAGSAFVGGDTTSGPTIVLVGTALGDTAGVAPVIRSGARSGDVVAVLGRLGCAAAGLALLMRGRVEGEACVSVQQLPQPDYASARAAAAAASSMIDTSDGLIADLRHIAVASAVDINIHKASVPMAACVRDAAADCRVDPWTWVLTGGEDHAFIATFAPHQVPVGWHVVGEVSNGRGEVTLDSQVWDHAAGYEHFTNHSVPLLG